MAPTQGSHFSFRLVLLPPFWRHGELPREMHFSRDSGIIRVGRLDPEGVPPGKVWANAGFTGERGKLVSAQHAELQLDRHGNVLLTSWSRNGTFVRAEVAWTAPDRSPAAVSRTVRVGAGEWFQLIGPAAASFKAKAMLEPERRYTVCFGRPKLGSMGRCRLGSDADALDAMQYSLTADVTAPRVEEEEWPARRQAPPAPPAATAAAQQALPVQGAPAAPSRRATGRPSAATAAPAAPSRPAQPADDYNYADDYDEDMFKGESDREELLSMTAIERDMILAGRYDKQMRRSEVLAMREKLRVQRGQVGRGPVAVVQERDVVLAIHEQPLPLKDLVAKFKPLMSREKPELERFMAIVKKVATLVSVGGDKLVMLNDRTLKQYGPLLDSSSWGVSSSPAAGSARVAPAPAPAPAPARPSARPVRPIIDDDNSDDDFEDSPSMPRSAPKRAAPAASPLPFPWDGDDEVDEEEADNNGLVSGLSSPSGTSSGFSSPRGLPPKATGIPKRDGSGGSACGGGGGACGGGGGGGSFGPDGDATLRRPWPGATPQGVTPQAWPQETNQGAPVPSFVMGLEAEACWRALMRLGRLPECAVVEISDLCGRSTYNKLPHDQQELLLHWVHLVRKSERGKQSEYPQFAGPDGHGGVHVKDSVTKAVEAARAGLPASTRSTKLRQNRASAAAPKPEPAAEARAPQGGAGAAKSLAVPAEGDLMPLGSHKRRAEAAVSRAAVPHGNLDSHAAVVAQSEQPPTAGALATGGEATRDAASQLGRLQPRPPSCRDSGCSIAAAPACSDAGDSVSDGEAACTATGSAPVVPTPAEAPAAVPAPAPHPPLKRKKPFGMDSTDEDSSDEG